MAELADAQDSKSCEGNFMWVQVPPSAPLNKSTICSMFENIEILIYGVLFCFRHNLGKNMYLYVLAGICYVEFKISNEFLINFCRGRRVSLAKPEYITYYTTINNKDFFYCSIFSKLNRIYIYELSLLTLNCLSITF